MPSTPTPPLLHDDEGEDDHVDVERRRLDAQAPFALAAEEAFFHKFLLEPSDLARCVSWKCAHAGAGVSADSVMPDAQVGFHLYSSSSFPRKCRVLRVHAVRMCPYVVCLWHAPAQTSHSIVAHSVHSPGQARKIDAERMTYGVK